MVKQFTGLSVSTSVQILDWRIACLQSFSGLVLAYSCVWSNTIWWYSISSLYLVLCANIGWSNEEPVYCEFIFILAISINLETLQYYHRAKEVSVTKIHWCFNLRAWKNEFGQLLEEDTLRLMERNQHIGHYLIFCMSLQLSHISLF